MNQRTAISFVHTDTTEYVIKKEGRYIGDILLMIPETLAIRNVLHQAIQNKYMKIIIESDSLVAIQANMGTVVQKNICNLDEDINILLINLIILVLHTIRDLLIY